ncbi:MAG: hypothetical protein Q7K57_61335 [Burkholderiaceae bacterium]|nr:hypothetical protein [Burkholderiaceae bacterium]
MNWMHYLGLVFVLHLPVLFVLYTLWIQHERAAIWKLDPGYRRHVWWVHYGWHIFGVIGYMPDVAANYTTLRWIFGRKPAPGAHTFSKQLWHLCREEDDRGRLANMVADVLDRIAPSGDHTHR